MLMNARLESGAPLANVFITGYNVTKKTLQMCAVVAATRPIIATRSAKCGFSSPQCDQALN